MSFDKKAAIKWLLLILAFLLLGGAALIIGFEIAGYDVLGWFTTKYAYIVYFFLFVYAGIVVSLAVMDKVGK